MAGNTGLKTLGINGRYGQDQVMDDDVTDMQLGLSEIAN
jgi:hypothetical protein